MPIFGSAVLTYGVILMVLLAAVFWYVLNHTAWGRHVYAVGDDPEAAILSGIRVDRMLISVYTVAGFICALAGWALIGRIGAVSPQAGQLENINAITAVVIGGTSLFGGRGSILGTLFGALIVGVFSLGLQAVGHRPAMDAVHRRCADHRRRGVSTSGSERCRHERDKRTHPHRP